MIEVFGNWLDTTVQDTVRSLKINSCGAQTIGTEADTFYGVLSHLSTYSNMYFMSCPDLSNWRKFKVNVRFPPHKAAAEKSLWRPTMISIRHECCMPDSLYSNNAGMKNIYRIKADTISSLNRKNEKQLTDVAVKFRDEFSQPLFL